MKERERLFIKILKEFQEADALDSLILIGSWCQHFYRLYFNNSPEIPAIRTLDLDFLIPHRGKIKKDVNIPDVLTKLGFETTSNYPSGLIKFIHPDLSVEFLFPERGRGSNKPYEIKKLHINAQGLRFLTLLSENLMTISTDELKVTLPEPAAYVLHKFIIDRRRLKKDKSEKDLNTAKEIGEFLLDNPEQRIKLKKIFNALPKKWQGKIKTSVKNISPELHDFISNA
ncbi:MAG: GSU2403 family nucleotidyltransferase fold protein [Candidatus Euphemobacter frigidus]|nr:GSU2403 family nucleotidyltransferase fold protein [Candidatus Euphemobacter frigidus]MDP8275274.1 GSU2403 family nucleotidyltransferase fold protein [Candidatus Euphemobacter frigidus]